MKKSLLLQKNHDEMIAIYKSMTPEERLLAFFNHSQLISRLYEAGKKFRGGTFLPSSIGLCTTKDNSFNSTSRRQRPILATSNPIGSRKVNKNSLKQP